jgi:hypothetical protein
MFNVGYHITNPLIFMSVVVARRRKLVAAVGGVGGADGAVAPLVAPLVLPLVLPLVVAANI